MHFLSSSELEEISSTHDQDSPFIEHNLELFCRLCAIGNAPPYTTIQDAFNLPPDISVRKRKEYSFNLLQIPAIQSRFRVLRTAFLESLDETMMMTRLEGAQVLIHRIQDPSTNSRDISPMITKLGELLYWKERGMGSEAKDPVRELLDMIKPAGALPSEVE